MSQGERGRARALLASIRQILLEHWDPIGVHEQPEAQREYDSYAGGVCHLLVAGATEQQIADYLGLIEREELGLPGLDPERATAAARKLRLLDVTALRTSRTEGEA